MRCFQLTLLQRPRNSPPPRAFGLIHTRRALLFSQSFIQAHGCSLLYVSPKTRHGHTLFLYLNCCSCWGQFVLIVPLMSSHIIFRSFSPSLEWLAGETMVYFSSLAPHGHEHIEFLSFFLPVFAFLYSMLRNTTHLKGQCHEIFCFWFFS